MPAQSKTPVKTDSRPVEPARSSDTEVDAFLTRLNAVAPVTLEGRGRLIFAMDATMSRQPTWDLALGLQADMFRAVKEVGGLDVQLVYFRGYGETRASKWVSDPEALARLMTRVSCQGGYTQIRKVLTHTRRESEQAKVSAIVYVGDCMEEDIDELSQRAGALGLMGVPMFMFQEGRNPKAEIAFKEIARLTRGAYCHFDAGSARQLRDLLAAVAVYATGGRKALRDYGAATNSKAAVLECAPLHSKWCSTTTAAAWRVDVLRDASQAESCRHLQLLDELRSTDSQGAVLMEAYLDRRWRGWRSRNSDDGAKAKRSSPRGATMTAGEAYEVLGLKPGAKEEQIREAHRRLMMKFHPDQGGSTYLAARINEAKEVLLAIS